MLTGLQLKTKRKRQLQYPVIYNEIKRFFVWLFAEPIPETLLIPKESSLMIAEKHGVDGFIASNGCIHKFLRRHAIQTSVKLQGQAGGVCESVRSSTMEYPRQNISEHSVSNVYNADKSGHLYSVITSWTYLSLSEKRPDIQISALMLSKFCITIMVCANANGSHKLPMYHFGSFISPKCFMDFPGRT